MLRVESYRGGTFMEKKHQRGGGWGKVGRRVYGRLIQLWWVDQGLVKKCVLNIIGTRDTAWQPFFWP